MWLGMLFSVLNLAMLGYALFENEPPEYEGVSESLAELYRLRTAQCLMMGDITKCAPYTLETLIFNSFGEHLRRKDSERGVWMMVGVIVRAAIQMGYHRSVRQISSHHSWLSRIQGIHHITQRSQFSKVNSADECGVLSLNQMPSRPFLWAFRA